MHELVRERRFPHFFRSRRPGKLPVIPELVRERRFQGIFEAGNQANSLKQCIPAADYPWRQILHPSKDAISSWFVVVQMSWFNVVVHCHGSIVVVRGGSIVVVRSGS